MSYKNFTSLKEYVEIETIKKMTPVQINELLNKQQDKINALEKQIIDLKACLKNAEKGKL